MNSKQQTIHNKNSEDVLLERYVEEISQYTPLSFEEEQDLSTKIRSGNEQAKEKLIRANLMFVVSIARQYQSNNIAMIDLIDEGNIALIKAAGKFDASKGKRFAQFAVWDIRKAIEAYLPQEDIRMNRTATEHLPGKGKATDDNVTDITNHEELALAIENLTEREQIVLRSFFGFGEEQLTMSEIGIRNGWKRERVRQIRNRGLRRLHSYRNKNFH